MRQTAFFLLLLNFTAAKSAEAPSRMSPDSVLRSFVESGGVIMTQLAPFADEVVLDMVNAYEQAVYALVR